MATSARSTPRPLTDKQRLVLEFIAGFMRERGMSPTVREIAVNFKVTVNAAAGFLKALEDKGAISRPFAGSGRAIRVVGRCPCCGRPDQKKAR